MSIKWHMEVLTRRENLQDWAWMIGAFLLVAAFLAGTLGAYIYNIVKLAYIINDPISGMLVLRAVGIAFPPLGVVMGYI